MSTYDLFHRAQQAPGLSQTQKGVLIALLTFADSDGWAWPSLATLASYASVKERAAQAAMADLVAAGLVVRQERVGATCRFRVLVDKLPERGGAPKTPPQEKHPRTKDTPAGSAGEGCTKSTPGVQEMHRGGAPKAPEGSNEGSNEGTTQGSARKPHPGWTSLPPLPPAASPVEIQPEADPELDAHLAAVFAPEAQPVAPPPKKPLFACWVEQPKPAVVEEPEEEEDPLPADHLLLLTTRPDGSPAEPLAVASRLAGKLISVGIATPADLELATTDDVAKAVGKPGMQAIDRALRAWGTRLLLPTRAMVEDIRARAQSGEADLSPVEELLLKKAHIKLSEVRNANDFACYTLSQRIDAARSNL